jgi:hypothetical protein
MPSDRPSPIPKSERMAGLRRASRIARRLGFVGRIEYRHVYSQSGGAQYGLAASKEHDLLSVYAEAFERDADPDEFSLEAILAHECGHQLLARDRRLNRNLPQAWSGVSEEIVASLLGSILASTEKDQQDLLFKAIFEAQKHGFASDAAILFLMEFRALLEKIV